MPIYEYECSKCGHHVEAWQKFSDPPISKCEQCRGRMKKLISHSTFHLKGTGWYVTDYAKKSGSSPSSEPKSPAKESGGESKSSGETSKETKASSKKSKDKSS